MKLAQEMVDRCISFFPEGDLDVCTGKALCGLARQDILTYPGKIERAMLKNCFAGSRHLFTRQLLFALLLCTLLLSVRVAHQIVHSLPPIITNATFANDIIQNILLGASYALQWGASSPDGVTGDSDILETMMTDSGQPTPIFYTMKDFKNYFGPGTPLYRTTISLPSVTVLASHAKTMLVNHLPSDQTVMVNGTTVNLTPYQVLTINTPGA